MKENIIELKDDKKDFKELEDFLTKTKDLLPVPLDKRVNIHEYVKKILTFGKVKVYKIDDNIVGAILGYMNDTIKEEAYISLLLIDNIYQSKGIGTSLIKSFEKQAVQNNMKIIKLYTHKDNDRAINFYKKNGFYISDEKSNAEYSVTLKKVIQKSYNILITSVGRRGYIVEYFKEALGNSGKVYVANSSDLTPAFKYADGSVVTPLIYDDNYIDFIIEFCKEKDIKLVISLFDIDLPVLSKNKERFDEEGIILVVSNNEFVEICNDKWKTYNFLKSKDIKVPKTYIDLKKLYKDIENNVIKYPIIIKPRWGMGSISILEADNEEELKILYNKAKRNIFETYLKYESSMDIENCVLFQEKINGVEYGLDVINDLNGDYVNTIVKRKYAMRSGETDCAKTEKNEKMERLGEKISSYSRHIANLDVDVFLTDNDLYVLEMNARFGGGYPFSHMAGVNLPKAIITWAQGEKVDNSLLYAKNNILCHKDIRIIEL